MARIDKSLLMRRFDMRASTYEHVTPIQGRMAGMLLSGISNKIEGRPVRRVIELGCGTGRLTALLMQRFPDARIMAVDLAPAMIARARLRCPEARFVVADAEELVHTLKPGFDLIVSNAAVQWFETPAETLAAYRGCLADGGCMAMSTFGEHTFSELRRAMSDAYGPQKADAVKHHLLTLMPAAFWRRVFPDAAIEEKRLSVRYRDVRAFLRSLQQAGVTYAGVNRRFLTLSLLRRIIELYPENGTVTNAKNQKRKSEITATYHAINLYVNGPCGACRALSAGAAQAGVLQGKL